MDATFEFLRCIPISEEQELELTDVLVARFDKKRAADLIGELNDIQPLPSLRHLRRIRAVEDGSGELEIILCPANAEEESHADSMPDVVAEFVKRQELSPTRTRVSGDTPSRHIAPMQVPASVPLTKAKWSEWKSFWPMPWRAPPPDTCAAITEDLRIRAEKHMRSIIQLSEANAGVNAAVIVDPDEDSVIAESTDKSEDYPLNHAVMEAIAKASKIEVEAGRSPKRQRIESEVVHSTERQYLCTGYEIYTLKEPCLMCAMAMVHSRFQRVIFSREDFEGGAFTVHALHKNARLNHRYSVCHLKEKVA